MAAGWEVRFARAYDGIDVAYATYGDGPRDVVLLHGFTTHLDFVGDSPWHSYWTRRLGERFRVIQLDKRGTGLSDRSLGHGSIEDRTRDVLAVMDAVGSDQAAVVGISEGGPIGLTFAALYPERVTKLVLYGTFARILWAPDYPFGIAPEVADGFVSWVGSSWGEGEIFGDLFMTHAPDRKAASRLMSKFERNACTRQMATEITRRNLEIDIRDVLVGIRTPTLVMHNAGDPLVPVSAGRYLADNIAGAEYYEAEGDYHSTWVPSEFESLMHRAMRFLCDEELPALPTTPRGSAPRRTLATILFTDIVGSTETAAAVGDTEWRRRLEEHDRLAAEATRRAGGRVVKNTGDGILALFDGPSRAIHAAQELKPSASIFERVCTRARSSSATTTSLGSACTSRRACCRWREPVRWWPAEPPESWQRGRGSASRVEERTP
jgi:pimeloyl-ACP methyl ester carboxylesterase